MRKSTCGKVAIGLLAAAMVAGQVPVPAFAQAAQVAGQAGKRRPVVVTDGAGAGNAAAKGATAGKSATWSDVSGQALDNIGANSADDPNDTRLVSHVVMKNVAGENQAEYIYDAAQHGVEAYVVDAQGNAIEGADVSYSYSEVAEGSAGNNLTPLGGAPHDAGKYVVTATFQGNETYKPDSNTADLTIKPRRMAMQFSSMSKIAGEKDPALLSDIVDLDANDAPWQGGGSAYDAAEELEGYIEREEIDAMREPGEEPGEYTISGTIYGQVTWSNRNFILTVQNGTMCIDPSLSVAVDGQGTAAAVKTDDDADDEDEGWSFEGGSEGTTAKLNATPKAGYVFAGWTVDEGNAAIADASAAKTTVTMGSKNARVTAHFKAASGKKDTKTATTTTTTTVAKAGAKKQAGKDLPKTGDHVAAIVVAAGIAGVAVLGIGIAMVIKRRRQ